MNERRGQSAANNNRIYPSAFFIARPASTPTPSLQHQHPIINKLFYCPTDSRGTRPSLSSLNLFIPCTLLSTKIFVASSVLLLLLLLLCINPNIIEWELFTLLSRLCVNIQQGSDPVSPKVGSCTSAPAESSACVSYFHPLSRSLFPIPTPPYHSLSLVPYICPPQGGLHELRTTFAFDRSWQGLESGVQWINFPVKIKGIPRMAPLCHAV